ADFVTRSRSHTGRLPVSSADTLEAEALRLLAAFFDDRENPRRKPIRLIGVRAEKLVREPADSAALPLLARDDPNGRRPPAEGAGRPGAGRTPPWVPPPRPAGRGSVPGPVLDHQRSPAIGARPGSPVLRRGRGEGSGRPSLAPDRSPPPGTPGRGPRGG